MFVDEFGTDDLNNVGAGRITNIMVLDSLCDYGMECLK